MNGKLFGGQFIANALTAAMQTAESRTPRSLQGLFLRPGHADAPLQLDVERVHDGARSSYRRVLMRQSGRTIFTAQVYLSDALSACPDAHQSCPRSRRRRSRGQRFGNWRSVIAIGSTLSSCRG